MSVDLDDLRKKDDADSEPEPPASASPVGLPTVAFGVILVVIVVAALRLAKTVLVPVVFGVLISYALDPIVTSLSKRGLARGFVATLVLFAVVAGAGWLGWGLRNQAVALASELPVAAERVRSSLRTVEGGAGAGNPVQKVQQAAKTIEKAAAEASHTAAEGPAASRVVVETPPVKVSEVLWSGSLQAAEVAAQSVVVFFLALYLLAAGDLFKRKLVKLAGPSLSQKKVTLQILQDIDRQVAAFLLIRLTISVIVAVATWLALLGIGLRQSGVWGIVVGVFNLVPYVGPTVVMMCVAVVAFVQFNTWPMAAAAAGAVVAVATFEGYWLTPWLTGRAARMNSVAVFIGLLFWGWVWGTAGLLLAVPLLMVSKAVCDRVEDLQPVGELLGE